MTMTADDTDCKTESHRKEIKQSTAHKLGVEGKKWNLENAQYPNDIGKVSKISRTNE